MRLRLCFSAFSIILCSCTTTPTGQTQYSCTGMPDKVQCLSARQALAASQSSASFTLSGDTTGLPSIRETRQQQRSSPWRSAPGIMPVWIAPFEDTEGDLHMDMLIYVQVTPGYWQTPAPSYPSDAPTPLPRPVDSSPDAALTELSGSAASPTDISHSDQ